MFHHTVMFRFKPGTTQSQIDAITAGLAALPADIVELVVYRFGPDAGITDESWDYAVAADFHDSSGYFAYRDHPAHRAVVDERIDPNVEEFARIQFYS
jgi:hypothetical protein